jgi:hypothetical protein
MEMGPAQRLDFARRPLVEVILIMVIIDLLKRVSKQNALRSQGDSPHCE